MGLGLYIEGDVGLDLIISTLYGPSPVRGLPALRFNLSSSMFVLGAIMRFAMSSLSSSSLYWSPPSSESSSSSTSSSEDASSSSVMTGTFRDRCSSSARRRFAMFSWLAAWSADALDKFKVHDDGQTAHERTTRHRCNHEALVLVSQFLGRWLRTRPRATS